MWTNPNGVSTGELVASRIYLCRMTKLLALRQATTSSSLAGPVGRKLVACIVFR
jgi:hypothetical protein